MSKQNSLEAPAPAVFPGRVCLALASALACACSDHVVELGEVSQNVTAASNCAVSEAGSILVQNQAQLNQLAGCEQIEGDLFVRPFTGADFTPLASLRVVQGKLDLGRLSLFDGLEETDLGPNPPAAESDPETEGQDPETALLESGWLTSLAGFERLERVGSLSVSGISAPSLEPFSNLRALTGEGSLQLGHCQNLTDLHGLEALSGLVDLTVACESLLSLRGLSFPARLRNVELVANGEFPLVEGEHTQLADLGDFDVEEVALLRIESTALTGLAGLERLRQAGTLIVYANPLLVDLSALNSLSSVDTLVVQMNSLLERLPEFSSLQTLRALRVGYNASLTSIGRFSGLREDLEFYGVASTDLLDPHQLSVDAVSRHRPDEIEIESNPALRQLSLPKGWVKAGYLSISDNQQLERIDFSELYSIDRLGIVANPVLEQVELGNLRRADELYLGGTPALLQAFAALPTFERTVVNLDGSPLEDDSPVE